jgi:glyoxalase family protein
MAAGARDLGMPSSPPPALRGLHHVTAITASAQRNLDFYTRVLGLRLVKQTVNQDDVSAYHLFYADELGRPGTDLTFFEWEHVTPARPGAGTISETAFRVAGGKKSLEHWIKWFTQQGVAHGGIDEVEGPPSVSFHDPEGQCLRLMAEPEGGKFHPWRGSPVPPAAAIVGLGAVSLTVRDFEAMARFLGEVLGFRAKVGDSGLFETGEGGPGAQLQVIKSASRGSQGSGGVHHVAWGVADVPELLAWQKHVESFRLHTSGLVDRHYFQSLYFRIPEGILFELATAGPGFTADGEPLEQLGEKLSLPPFLEPRRAEIAAGLKPLQYTPAPKS